MKRHIFSKLLLSADDKVPPVSPKHPIPNKLPKKEPEDETKKTHRDSNGKSFDDYLNEENTSQSLIKSSKGFFSYCFDDVDGYCREFDTLAECRREARQHSKENPDFEVYIYGMSSMKFVNGKEL